MHSGTHMRLRSRAGMPQLHINFYLFIISEPRASEISLVLGLLAQPAAAPILMLQVVLFSRWRLRLLRRKCLQL